MKKKLLLIPSITLLLCGCSLEDLMFWKKPDQGQNQQENNNKPNNGDSDTTETDTETDIEPGTDTDPLVPIEDDRFEGFYIRDSEVIVNIGDTVKFAPTVEILYKDGYSWDNIDSYTWSIGNEAIASVSKITGKVTGVSKGKTTLSFSIGGCSHVSTIPVYVIDSETDIVESWKKMDGTDQIEEKDTIVIACPQKGKVANTTDTGMHLHSSNATFSGNTITSLSADAAQFYVYSDPRGRDGYTFESQDDKYLACTNKEKVSFFDSYHSSQTVWDVSYDSEQGIWDMRPGGTTIDAWMMYNCDTETFSTSQSSETERMLVVSLYKLVKTINI